MSARRRLWCLGVAPPELARPSTLELLARFGVEPILGCPPELDAGALLRVVEAWTGRGLRFHLAPLDPGDAGFGAVGGEAAARRTEALLETLRPTGFRPAGVVLRLGGDSSSASLRRRVGAAVVASWRPGRARHRADAAASEQRYARLARDLREASLEASAEVPGALALLAPEAGGRAEALLDLGGVEAGWDRVALRVESARLEDLTGVGGLRRGALAVLAQAHRERFGARAALSLGAVGAGPRGDRPVLSTPRALGVDVASARAEGIGELWLDGLDGVLRRGRPADWLEALVGAGPRRAPAWARSSAGLARAAVRGAGSW